MLRKRLVILLSVLGLATGCGQLVEHTLNKVQGNGKVTTDTRNVSDFTSLEVSSGLLVNITAQQATKVEVTTDENLQSYLKTEVADGKLRIFTDGGRIAFSKRPEITVSVPDLKNLTVSDACRVNLAEAKAGEMSIELNGASRLEAKGAVQTLKANINGASRLEAKDLKAGKVSVEANGASRATVFASESLDANANGASNISYYGKPPQVKPEANGGSRVSAVGD